MISFKELLHGHVISEVSHEHQINLEDLQKKINIIRQEWGKPMIVTSGYRTMQDHLRIYSEIAARNGKQFDAKKVPMGSCHLKGCAVDISDPKGELQKWLKDHPEILEKAELFCEDGTTNWVHFQTKPFRSYKSGGSRWFYP